MQNLDHIVNPIDIKYEVGRKMDLHLGKEVFK